MVSYHLSKYCKNGDWIFSMNTRSETPKLKTTWFSCSWSISLHLVLAYQDITKPSIHSFWRKKQVMADITKIPVRYLILSIHHWIHTFSLLIFPRQISFYQFSTSFDLLFIHFWDDGNTISSYKLHIQHCPPQQTRWAFVLGDSGAYLA